MRAWAAGLRASGARLSPAQRAASRASSGHFEGGPWGSAPWSPSAAASAAHMRLPAIEPHRHSLAYAFLGQAP